MKHLFTLYIFCFVHLTCIGQNIITTIAGNGTAGYSGDGGSATSAQLNNASGVCKDISGNIYIADWGNHRVRKVDPAGIITTIAGNGAPGYSGDAGPATNASLYYPNAVSTDGNENVYIADEYNNVIRKVTTSGIIYTVVGNGTPGFSGDGGQASAAQLFIVTGVAVDTAGNIYIREIRVYVR